jgi:DNA polymerase-1
MQRMFGERIAMNSPIQGSAADLIKIAMISVNNKLKESQLKSRLILQIHDELVFDAPVDEIERLSEIIRREMSSAMDFGVPLEVEIGVGNNWLEAH